MGLSRRGKEPRCKEGVSGLPPLLPLRALFTRYVRDLHSSASFSRAEASFGGIRFPGTPRGCSRWISSDKRGLPSAVMTLTPPVRWRMALRNSADAIPSRNGTFRTTKFMIASNEKQFTGCIRHRQTDFLSTAPAGLSPQVRRDRQSRGRRGRAISILTSWAIRRCSITSTRSASATASATSAARVFIELVPRAATRKA